GNFEGVAQLSGRAPALYLPRRRPGLGQRFADRPATATVGNGDQRVEGRGVVGEAPTPERDVDADPLRHPTLQLGAPGGGVAVVMSRPATRRAGVTHATRGAPSTSTVQQPHWPCGLHPSFGERFPTRSRSTSSSDAPSSGTSTSTPSTRNLRFTGAG